MAIKPAINQFNGGEISPWLEGRFDWDKYNYSAKKCQNFIPLVEGSLRRRGGSHFVCLAVSAVKVAVPFIVKIAENITPSLFINDKSYDLYPAQKEGDYFVFKTSLLFSAGENLSISVECSGYITQNKDIWVNENQEEIEIELQKKDMSSYLLTVIKANDDIELTLNGTSDNPYSSKSGEKIIWIASYMGNSNNGEVFIYKDTTLVLNIVDDIPVLTTDDIMTISSPNEGYVELAKGRYRLTMVGGGGGALFLGVGASPNWFNGGSGAAVDLEVNLSQGKYYYRSGKKEINGWKSINKPVPSDGSSSVFKLGDVIVAEAKNGWGGGGAGEYSVDYSYVVKTYLTTNGNGGGSEQNFTGKSVFGDYGRGTQIVGYKRNNDVYDIEFNDATNGYFSLKFLGSD